MAVTTMASTTATSTSTTTTTTTPRPLRPRASFSRSLRRSSATASTPNLHAAFHAHSKQKTSALLSRKTSLAALTPSSLATIPDASENYGLNSVLSESSHNIMVVPATPGKPSLDDVAVGDLVDVPGGMYGTVRFVGSVQGKKGVFAGIELNREFASRGKNNGDVDGVNYFTTSAPGAGIFVPVAKASRRDSPSSYPMTPGGLKGSASVNFSSPTPAVPRFSASVGPGARAASPQNKRPPRTSLPRPDSPVRRTQMTPGPRPSMTSSPTKTPANRFAQSVRGTAGDPSKRPSKLDLRSGQRSTSAMGGPMSFDEEPPLPTQTPKANGLSASVSAFNLRRPASRANQANEEEIERLKSQLEDRERQLKDQSATLADMESSLVELQGLIETNQNGPQNNDNNRNSMDDKDSTQLRSLLREKTDKIAMLTSEFDSHRADFRSTIDTLELASTETERVYEKRIEELVGELRELESRNLDVDSVASQLKQLEELVQELEEGLEDARRGEAEARGEAEFLRGEVERTRSELQRAKSGGSPNNGSNGTSSSLEKDLAQKEDEIRGLKAIIHSLSRDAGSGDEGSGAADGKAADGSLERQISELQSLLDKKNNREEELEQELEYLRRGNNNKSNHSHNNSSSNQRSSLRDSRDTVIPARSYETRSPELVQRKSNTLDTMHENDLQSNATTEASALWCEICETSGHDILTCTNMFGPDGASAAGGANVHNDDKGNDLAIHTKPPVSPSFAGARPAPLAPLSPARSKSASDTTGPVKIIPNPMESGPVAGKESGVMDPEKWCAVCERDGHDSVDCPFEDAF